MFTKKTTILLFFFFFLIPLIIFSQKSKDTEIWEPKPNEVYSSSDSLPPDDAIILFEGLDLSKWKAKWSDKDSGWQINDDGSVT
ncbi:MAG: hypothetical protein HN595_05310, partial [Flavobacteriaceae bacterium]|nr:hypothetical protein [Flavobacteriaceae bacterium]